MTESMVRTARRPPQGDHSTARHSHTMSVDSQVLSVMFHTLNQAIIEDVGSTTVFKNDGVTPSRQSAQEIKESRKRSYLNVLSHEQVTSEFPCSETSATMDVCAERTSSSRPFSMLQMNTGRTEGVIGDWTRNVLHVKTESCSCTILYSVSW